MMKKKLRAYVLTISVTQRDFSRRPDLNRYTGAMRLGQAFAIPQRGHYT